MLVSKLIEQLQKLPHDIPVFTQLAYEDDEPRRTPFRFGEVEQLLFVQESETMTDDPPRIVSAIVFAKGPGHPFEPARTLVVTVSPAVSSGISNA